MTHAADPRQALGERPLLDMVPAMGRFSKRKRHHDPISELLRRRPELEPMARSIANCANTLKVLLELPEGADPFAMLLEYNPCNRRLCPMCEWRRSMVWRGRLLSGLDAFFQAHPTHTAIFATFTVKNSPVEELGASVKHILASWNRLAQCKFFPSPFWFRRVEVTRGQRPRGPDAAPPPPTSERVKADDNDPTIPLQSHSRVRACDGNTPALWVHPHLHALILVPASYFSHGYIRQSEWVRQWQMAARLDYMPSVDVRRARAKFTTAEAFYDARAAGIEAMKYTTKATDMVQMGDGLGEFAHQMRGHRLVGMSQKLRQFVPDHDPTDKEMGDDREAGLPRLFAGVECLAQWDREVSDYTLRPA